jgi:hypothetical protein
MKVRLLVNLKTEDGTVHGAGSVFESPLPDFITNNLSYPNIVLVTESDAVSETVATEEPEVVQAPKTLKRKKA